MKDQNRHYIDREFIHENILVFFHIASSLKEEQRIIAHKKPR